MREERQSNHLRRRLPRLQTLQMQPLCSTSIPLLDHGFPRLQELLLRQLLLPSGPPASGQGSSTLRNCTKHAATIAQSRDEATIVVAGTIEVMDRMSYSPDIGPGGGKC